MPAQPIEVQTRYIAESMQMLKNVGIEAGGLTMCWSYPKDKNHVLGETALRAAERICGLKYVMVFNDTGDGPGVIYRRDDGGMAVSLRPNVGDVYDHTFGKKTEADIQRDADQTTTTSDAAGVITALMLDYSMTPAEHPWPRLPSVRRGDIDRCPDLDYKRRRIRMASHLHTVRSR